MDLRNQLLLEHSRKNCNTIIEWVGNDLSRFNQLFKLFLNTNGAESDPRVQQRAAWPMSYCVIAHPGFLNNKFNSLIKNLKKPGIHNSVKRNTVKLLQEIDIPEKYEGEIMEICFSYIESPKEAVAVKAFSLTILGKFAQKYPEIIPEIKLLIEDQIAHQSAAFKVRAKILLKQFSSL